MKPHIKPCNCETCMKYHYETRETFGNLKDAMGNQIDKTYPLKDLEKEPSWEEDFDLRFNNNWKKDIEFWEKDLRVKDFSPFKRVN